MKKLFFLLFGLFLSLNLSYASDLISKASNGVLNENSLGVKKLSDEEMRQVKGGVKFTEIRFLENFSTNSQGHSIHSTYSRIDLSQDEERGRYINLDNGKSGYDNYMSYITYARAGTLYIREQYNETTNYKTYDFIIKDSLGTSFVADSFARAVIRDYQRQRY